MLVEEIMNKKPITISPSTTISQAFNLLNKHRIRHLPVIDCEGSVLGIVSDRDIRDASPSIFNPDDNNFLNNEIKTIMSTPVVTAHPLDFIEDTARIFYDHGFASVPVVSDNKLVGIITEKDMLYTLIQLTGTHVKNSHVELKMKKKPYILPQITAAFEKHRIKIASMLIYPDEQNPNYNILIIRFQTTNPKPILNELIKDGFELMFPTHNNSSDF